jgi:TolA-binding protein
MHQYLKLRNRANAGILSGPRYLSSRLKALGKHKSALAIVLLLAAFTPTRAEACSSEWFAVSGILAEPTPGDSLARQAYEMRKSRAWADVNACEKRQKDEKRRKVEEERQQQAYLQERQRLDQERTRAEEAARTQAYAEEANRQANADLLATISKAILEGRCEDAKTVALTASRLDLADQAMRLCKPAAKQSTIGKSPANKMQQRQPVALKPVASNIPPSSKAVDANAQVHADLTKPTTSAKQIPSLSGAFAAIDRPATGDAFEDGYNYGYRLWEAKLYREAQSTLEETLARFPNHKRASYARTLLGRAWLDDKKPATAVRVFYNNYKADPRGARAPDSLFFLGSALTDLGKATEACEAFSELTKSYPDEATGRLADRLKSGKIRAKCK